MHLSVDLAATVTEALGLQPFHKRTAAGASLLEGDLHLDSKDLLLPGRDENFDDEERDESMSQCSCILYTSEVDSIKYTICGQWLVVVLYTCYLIKITVYLSVTGSGIHAYTREYAAH